MTVDFIPCVIFRLQKYIFLASAQNQTFDES